MQNMDTNKGKEERKLRKKEFDMQVIIKTVGPGINGAAMCFLIRVCGSLLVP